MNYRKVTEPEILYRFSRRFLPVGDYFFFKFHINIINYNIQIKQKFPSPIGTVEEGGAIRRTIPFGGGGLLIIRV